MNPGRLRRLTLGNEDNLSQTSAPLESRREAKLVAEGEIDGSLKSPKKGLSRSGKKTLPGNRREKDHSVGGGSTRPLWCPVRVLKMTSVQDFNF